MRKLLAFMAMALIASLSVVSSALAHGDDWGDRGDNQHGYGDGWGHHDRSTRCNGVYTGVTIKDDVIVPKNGSCTLTNSTVKGDVEVSRNAYFQSTNTSIREDVEADDALSIFIDSGSAIGGDITADHTAQVFVFNSTVNGGISVDRSTDTVNLCGNTVKGIGIGVVRSGRDILVGDPLTVDCAGNTVTRGSVLIANNKTDVELVVRGNTLGRGSMYVLGNSGSSDKFVQNNTGGRLLWCGYNSSPFVGSPNPGFQRYLGQCSA
jgi:hypothetical protein